tara:strand:+ start:4573 stop:4842 length:270 start_codon:yes stop_codon:yes gene_type:complete
LGIKSKILIWLSRQQVVYSGIIIIKIIKVMSLITNQRELNTYLKTTFPWYTHGNQQKRFVRTFDFYMFSQFDSDVQVINDDFLIYIGTL